MSNLPYIHMEIMERASKKFIILFAESCIMALLMHHNDRLTRKSYIIPRQKYEI